MHFSNGPRIARSRSSYHDREFRNQYLGAAASFISLMYQKIFELACPRPGISNRSVLLAISGPSCSGKTTLAARVGEYAIEHGRRVEVIHFDDFLRPESEYPRRSPEHIGYYEDAFDYGGLMREVQRRSSGAGHPELLIVEGEFLLRREYRDDWDVKVWIEIEDRLALARGIERDAEFFGSRQEVERIYLNRCLPANRFHRRVDEPHLVADLVLTPTTDGLVVRSLR